MKHKVLNLRCVLACILFAGVGAGTASAQSADKSTEPCETAGTCPEPQPAAPPPQGQSYTAPTAEPPAAMPEEKFERRYGLGISAGGGVSDWFAQGMRDVSGVSGTWEARLYVGLNQPIGLELAYVGRASSLTPFLAPNLDSTLVGNGVEAVARVNVFHDLIVQPYGIVGIGWTHWSASDVTLADFGVQDSDDTLQIPLGAGASWKAPFGLLVDARFTFRATLNDGLVVAEIPTVNGVPLAAAGFVDMDNWEASARIGYTF
jgi:hypothetical protein